LAFFPIGAIFAFLAAIMAFLITYNEYSRHFKEKGRAVRAALQAGVSAFLFFLALSLAAVILLNRVLGTRP
jgi:hypothetical protein